MKIAKWFGSLTTSSKFNQILAGIEFEFVNSKERILLRAIEIKKSVRPKGYSFSKHSYISKVQSGDVVGVGYGEDEFELLAIQKSIAEAAERCIFRMFKNQNPETVVSSNGWAAHMTREKAHRAGLEELLERDAVLVHWLVQTAISEISVETVPRWLTDWIKGELRYSPQFNQLKVGVSTLGILPSVSVALIDPLGHAVISHATASNLSEGISKALTEACRIGQIAYEGHSKETSKYLFRDLEATKYGPQDHAMFYAYHERFPEWYFGPETNWKSANTNWKFRYNSFDLREVPNEFRLVAEGPIFIGYVTSNVVQDLFLGPTNSAINKTRLNFDRLKKAKLDFVEPYGLPHCVP